MSPSIINIATIRTALQEAGLKSTPQRIVILTYLMKTKKHPSAEEVYQQISPENPSISLNTVYKTLETLSSSGLCSKVHASDGLLRYDGKLNDHHHIYLTDTDEIIDYEDDELIKLIKNHLASKKLDHIDIKQVSVHINATKTNL